MVENAPECLVRPLTEAELIALELGVGVANPFYQPAQISIAMAALGRPDDLLVMGGFDVAGRLIGFLPLVKDRGLARMPITYWRNWMHDFCFLGHAGIAAGYEREFYSALFIWLERESDLPLLRLTHMAAPAAGFLSDNLPKGGAHYGYRSLREERAVLVPSDDLDGEAYLVKNIRAKKRKEYRRLEKRLGELGKIVYREWTNGTDGDGADWQAWLKRFFALEAKGWKGKQGTAIAGNHAQVNYYRQACANAAHKGQLFLAELCLDERVLAGILGFVENNILFTAKIAYDEAYKRYSPGVMLELALTRSALDNHKFTLVDSCAKADHQMIDHLWAERLPIEQWVIGLGGWRGNQLARLCRTLEQFAARMREMKKGHAD